MPSIFGIPPGNGAHRYARALEATGGSTIKALEMVNPGKYSTGRSKEVQLPPYTPLDPSNDRDIIGYQQRALGLGNGTIKQASPVNQMGAAPPGLPGTGTGLTPALDNRFVVGGDGSFQQSYSRIGGAGSTGLDN